MAGHTTPDHLRRLAKSSEKCTTHSIRVTETCLLRNNIGGMDRIFHQTSWRLQSDILDRLCRRLTGLSPE
jgi:hypothetical protein